MDNTEKLCMNCMTVGKSPSNGEFCSNCGVREENVWAAPHHLKPRTMLNNKYLVGKVIGEGGFGITYVGWDIALSVKIAVKEYYPNGFVTRDSEFDSTVISLSGDKGEFYLHGRDRFIEEARRLAKFFGMPGIVSVKDFFAENDTAYIIMEYLEGATMRTVLSNMGGSMPEAHVLEIMKPLIRSLAEMHRAGVIHRDIAPDNIMIQPDGSIKLLDFGAAREVAMDGKSNSAVMKHGYTPQEQYGTDNTIQGPWTDVYALCATIYRAIEGDTPPDAISRMRQDMFAGFTIPVSGNTNRVVMKGLAVLPGDRWQDIGELWNELYQSSQVQQTQPVTILTNPAQKLMKQFSRIKNRIDSISFSRKTEANSHPSIGRLVGIRGIDGQYNSMSFPIHDRAALGRDPSKCAVVFDANTQGVSSVHCVLVRTASGLQLYDCGSTYGTFLGESKLTANVPVELRYGETFYLGDRRNAFITY